MGVRTGRSSMKKKADAGGFLYEQVAAAIAEQIRRQNLKAGERCPSVRTVCKQFGVSLATAVQALSILEGEGIIEARPQSGYFVKATVPPDSFLVPESQRAPEVSSCKVETAPFISEIVAAARNPANVPLGAATFSPALLPVAALHRSMSAAARELGPDVTLYELPAGNEELRRTIARRSVEAGIQVSADDVIITNGCMEALSLALAASCKPGDTVAVETPIFFGILDLVAALDLKVAPVTSHPVTGFDVDCLEQVMEREEIKAIIAIPNYCNPGGGCMPDDRKKKLAQIAARACIPLIEDDIYGDLYQGERRPPAVKSFDKKGDVIYCSSFSKALSPGLRLGWMIAGKYTSRVQRQKFTRSVACPTLTQSAVAAFLKGPAYDRHLQDLRVKVTTQLRQYTMAVLDAFPDGTRVSQPAGGFVLWVQMPGGTDANAVFERARAAKISVIPGPAFSAIRGQYPEYLRISCGYPLSKTMGDALRKLGRLAGECSR